MSRHCGCGVDVHAHVIPGEFPSYLGGAAPPGWPSMAPAQDCQHRRVMIDGKNYRTVSDKCWTTARRLADFADMGLELQAISPMPELLSYWMAPAAGAQLVRFLNEQIAGMVAESGGQLDRPGRRAAAGPGPGDPRTALPQGVARTARRGDRQQHQRRGRSAIRAGCLSSRPAPRWTCRSSCTRCARPAWTAWWGRRRCSRCWPIPPTWAWPPPRC